MSNPLFQLATTDTAFLLRLSKTQCNYLLRLYKAHADGVDFCEGGGWSEKRDSIYMLDVGGLSSLHRKGLVWWFIGSDGKANGFRGLTDAGRLLAQLLIEAGLTIENTNTTSVLKRIERREAA